MTIVSSFLAFPCISWWARAQLSEVIILDGGENFQKMSYRNKYRISGANNSIVLSVPLVNGRSQRVPMADVSIHNEVRWRTQHWRSLVSVYKRSPYFDYYADSLRPLFENLFTRLIDFDRETVLWAKRQLKLKFEIQETDVYVKQYPSDVIDLRNEKPRFSYFPAYYQVFEDRIGFLPDLSILDLLFSIGPGAGEYLKGVDFASPD